MRVLFVGAHPDDIEYGCAGLIRKLIEQGSDVAWIIMSNGENDLEKTEEQRLAELKMSSQILGVKEEKIFMLGCPDGYILDDADTVKKLTSIIDKLSPGLVVTHSYDDRHQDHRNTAYSVRAACWGVCNLIFFQSYSTMNFQPSIFVDISEVVDKKIESLNCYKTQVEKYTKRHIDFVETAISTDKKNGGNIHCAYAEGFLSVNCVWNI